MEDFFCWVLFFSKVHIECHIEMSNGAGIHPKNAIKKVIKGLGKAVKAHTKQAKMLKGAINGGSKKGNGKKA